MRSFNRGMGLALAVAITTGFFVTFSQTCFASRKPINSRMDDYNIKATILGDKIHGEMQIAYQNTSAAPMKEVRFRLDWNMSKRMEMSVTKVKDEGGKDLKWELQPLEFASFQSNQGQLVVHLLKPLPASESIKLNLTFQNESSAAISPNMITLQDDPYHSLDAWYPKAMSLKQGKWSIDDDRPSDYQVNLQLPAVYTVASTGRVVSEDAQSDQRKMSLQANNVRGFSIYARPDWKKHRRQIDQRTITILVAEEYKDWAPKLLDAAFETIPYYEKEYGPYPAQHLDIICLGTMEGAAHGSSAACNVLVVWLSGQFDQQYPLLIAHELAHQYYGSSVALCRDEIGWASNGLGLMMDRDYLLTKNYDYEPFKKSMSWFYLEAERRNYNTRLSQSIEEPMKSAPPWNSGWNMSLMHGKALYVCLMLEDLMGKEKFKTVMKETLKPYDGNNLSGADFVALCERISDMPLDWFFDDWHKGNAKLEYALTNANKTDRGWEVEVVQQGTAAFPVLVEAEFQSGEKITKRIDRTKKTNRINFSGQGELKKIVIDPLGIYPDLDPLNNILTDFK